MPLTRLTLHHPLFPFREFSKQQYFDSGGVFITVVLSTPILFNCILLLVGCCGMRLVHPHSIVPIPLLLQCLWLIQASSLLVQVKRAELTGRKPTAEATPSKAHKKAD